MLNPISTYRIQFHKDFTFKDFRRIIPYLHNLGISTIYASPIFESVPGSMHGYDTINPHQINPEIGTLEELREISGILKEKGMNWIQDIVPNHMAFDPGNSWLMDVLQKGPDSSYASFFDIKWAGDKDEQLMVPFLGNTAAEAIAAGDLTLVANKDGFKLKYFDTEWPVNDLVTDVKMPVEQVIALQHYRPCSWKETDSKINYRRFFTVNSLICLNMQHEETFNLYHEFIKSLLEEGIFQGLRVDHIDGLYNPEEYFSRLRELAGKDTYIVVEKILEEGEKLPAEWPVEGTTGYDFLAQLNNLFTERSAKKQFSKFYESLTAETKGIERLIRQKKAGILGEHMAGELENLYQLFLELELASPSELAKLKPGALKDAIGQLLICCPVYRFYGQSLPMPVEYIQPMEEVFREVNVVKNLHDAAALLEKVFLTMPYNGDEEYNVRATQFYLRCMQFSGPLMAKGVEDTLMYTYNRFIAHNEVGDAPEAFGYKGNDFHHLMVERGMEMPVSLNGTSTHDTKRGEDVRARLNILSDIPDEWIIKVKEWRKLNSEIAAGLEPNDEYFIYQTLAGSYPMPDTTEDNYLQRLQEYLEKALREGKVNSNWADPDTDYENLVKAFAAGILDQSSAFWQSFEPFHRKISDYGIINSLSQMLLKFTCPGIPDVYQGTELWDLSLVDPDNRRPVDYGVRESWLQDFNDSATSLKVLWEDRYSGKIKLNLLHTLLTRLKPFAEILTSGVYIPLEVTGNGANHFLAFARKHQEEWLIVIVPLHLAQLGNPHIIESINLSETFIDLPTRASFKMTNLIGSETGTISNSRIAIGELTGEFPLGLVHLEQVNKSRSAGILLHLTSLPSSFGIGDMGLEAMDFVDFLASADQRYWQLLPMNPIGAEQSYSPYSSVSAMAGNTMLISQDLLYLNGYLEEKYLDKHSQPVKDVVDFDKAAHVKEKMLLKAYETWKANGGEKDEIFHDFCLDQQEWLDDFALYSALKLLKGGKPWYEWPTEFRDRDAEQLQQFSAVYQEDIQFIKWKQYIFFEQWESLKGYANASGVKLYGDLPFYVGYDSAEVWSNRNLFAVDPEGKMTGIAGVPPDYFNEEGQLWGMPVYNWENLKAEGYQWWLRRIRRNMEMYDILRLDHFRAFAGYWEVPAEEVNAIAGVWKTGPGAEFFDLLKAEFPNMPFIAEDLGEITDDVYQLRDQFGLDGMKVLQFGFGEDMPLSDHTPHNYLSDKFIVYTGTHDNNTTRGWFEQESNKVVRKNLDLYTGQKVGSKNINEVLTRLAYASVARIVILPMQDLLDLDGKARMNKPATVSGNWTWRMTKQPDRKIVKRLRSLVKTFGR